MSDKPTREVIAQLMNKPMDRRQFLRHMGVGIVSVFGAGMLLNMFDAKNAGTVILHGRPYGTGRFGK